MTLTEIFVTAGAIIGSVGGTSAIILGCSNWLGKVWAGRLMEQEKAQYAKELEDIKGKALLNAERYKIRLHKSEFIFQKQFEAASQFSSLVAHLTPTPQSLLEMYDGYSVQIKQTGKRCDEIIQYLEGFLANYGAVLGETDRKEIVSIVEKAAGVRYAYKNKPDELRYTEVPFILNRLGEVEKSLIEKFINQIST